MMSQGWDIILSFKVAQLRLKNAQDRETAYAEMHKLANTMVDNKQQMKNAKDLELELRQRLTSYDEKFTGTTICKI